jgi:hypothetical protein
MTIDPQLSVAVAALVAGYLMTVAGVGKGLLRWRQPPRRCPVCRHEQRDCICRENARRRGPHRWILR